MTSLLCDIIQAASLQLVTIAENPQREARLLMAHALETSYEEIYFANDRHLTPDEKAEFNRLLKRRLNQEPLSKIRGYREFWSRTFCVTADTLDPRPDSETIIQAVLDQFQDKTQTYRILDLGTGTGCLLLTLLSEYPQATGVGVDISEAAVLVAKENAHHHHLENRVSFIVGNWGDAISATFDIIISNPPYIATHEKLSKEVAAFDPFLALFAGDDGLKCYRALAMQIPNLITTSSKAFLELGAGQASDVIRIFSDGYIYEFYRDIQNFERCVILSRKTKPVK
jgi:release factor glutamine methyltransferase